MVHIRKAAVAGLFYPVDKQELLSVLKSFFDKTKKVLKEEKVKAIIVPHAGYIYSGQTAAWGYKQLPEEKKHFLLLGPSHQFPLSSLCSDTSNIWQTPLGRVRHLPLKNKLAGFILNSRPHQIEHCLEVQIPFLQYLYKDFSITCFLTGQGVDYKKTARSFLKNYPHSIFLISSDLSHYLSFERAKKKDERTIETILDLDKDYFLKEENLACGAEAILTLLEMASVKKWRAKKIFYDTSGTASGDESGVVGYCAIAFYV